MPMRLRVHHPLFAGFVGVIGILLALIVPLVGTGLRGELEELVTKLHLQERLHFAGFVENIPAALAAFDVAVIPSLQEGFGLALAEAMASGRPIVATRVGGMVEMAHHGEHALLVPPADSRALAKAVLGFIEDPAQGVKLGKAAQQHSESFSIDFRFSTSTNGVAR